MKKGNIERVEQKKKEEKGIIVTFESVLKASFLLFPSAHPFSTKTFRRKQVPSFLPNLILEDRDESLPVPSLYDRWKHGGISSIDLIDGQTRVHTPFTAKDFDKASREISPESIFLLSFPSSSSSSSFLPSIFFASLLRYLCPFSILHISLRSRENIPRETRTEPADFSWLPSDHKSPRSTPFRERSFRIPDWSR